MGDIFEVGDLMVFGKNGWVMSEIQLGALGEESRVVLVNRDDKKGYHLAGGTPQETVVPTEILRALIENDSCIWYGQKNR